MRSTARFLEGALFGVALGVGLGFLVFRNSGLRGLADLLATAPQPVSPREAVAPPPSWAEEPSEPQGTAAGFATNSEVLVASEVLEQEAEISEEMPVIPSEMEAYTSVEVEPLGVEGIPVWADIPSPEVEVAPDAEAAVEELQAEDLMVQAEAVEELQAEDGAVEEPAVEESATEELVVTEELVEEVDVEVAPVPSPADDLKARIEETRRRIRQELEQPFVVGGGVAAAETFAVTEAEPVIGEALAVEPSTEEQPAPEPPESTPSTLVEPEFVAEAEGAEHPPATRESAVDYEAMRSRIEETRSRLKAKAFDAMMTGESSLLGREPEDADLKLPAPTEVDGEIVQTIEETLREEES